MDKQALQIALALNEALESLSPQAETMLLTLNENHPDQLWELAKIGRLKTFATACNQMISRRLSTEIERLMALNPLPIAKAGESPNALARISHYRHLEQTAQEAVLYPLLEMDVPALEMEMLEEEMESSAS